VAGDEQDQERLDDLVTENSLPAHLIDAAGICSGEGEVWWRVLADRDNAPVPTIEWHSRLNVHPILLAGRPIAVAFVEEFPGVGPENENVRTVWRYVEFQTQGRTENALYRTSEHHQGLGERVALSEHPYTADLPPGWDHGLSVMLAGRITNGPQRREFGRSDYEGVRDQLLALNEAASIGAENARLTAKKRIVVSPEYLTEEGEFPAGVDVILRSKTDVDPERGDGGLAQLEWSFDADQLIAWTEHLVDTTLTRARVAPQLVGRHTEMTQTGPAFRARLLDSILAAQGKGRAWDEGLPEVLVAAQLVDSLPREQGGFGREWTAAGTAPVVERTSIIPEDEDAQVQRLGTEVGALLLSRRSALKVRHPDWTDDQIDEEIRLIDAENPIATLED
jgi:hypothetical protein